MNFISEIFEFGALQIQPTTARGSEGASVGSWQPFSIACCRHKEHRFTQNKFSAFWWFVDRESEWLEWPEAWSRLNLYSLLR